MIQPIRFAMIILMVAWPLAHSQGASARTILAQASSSPDPTAPAEAAPPVTAAPAPATPEVSSPPRPLTGGEAWNALLGNTISGTTSDGPYTEFFKPDGTVVHVDRDGKDTGHWALKEPSVCFTYPDDDEEDCRKPRVEGTHGAFLDGDGSSYRFDILPGNPKHL